MPKPFPSVLPNIQEKPTEVPAPPPPPPDCSAARETSSNIVRRGGTVDTVPLLCPGAEHEY